MSENEKVHTPIPPGRQFPQEEPDSENNKSINQKADPEEYKKEKEQPKKVSNPK